ncbi:MAG: hypothetical protein R3E96_14575 [Planctomycetota bacterium]
MTQLDYSNVDAVYGVASDGAGGVLAVGSVYDNHTWVVRLDATGQILWQSNTAGIIFNYPRAGVSDGAGGIYAGGLGYAGFAPQSFGGRDGWVARYDGQGNRLWLRGMGTTGRDEVTSLATAPGGGVYYAGTSFQGIGPDHGFMGLIDASGNLVWELDLPPGTEWDHVQIAPAAGGDVFVGGGTLGFLGTTYAGGKDAWVARVSPTGTIHWLEQFGTPEDERVMSLIPDNHGGVYAAGDTEDALFGVHTGATDGWLARFDSAGHRTWSLQQGGVSSDQWVTVMPIGTQDVLVGGVKHVVAGPGVSHSEIFLARYETDLVGNVYCANPVQNSAGTVARIEAKGSYLASDDDLRLTTYGLPGNRAAYYLAARLPGMITSPGGGMGNICLGGAIGRLNRPGEILTTATTGIVTLVIDTSNLPQGSTTAPILAGETWHFQLWYRDLLPAPTSIFSEAVAVPFE